MSLKPIPSVQVTNPGNTQVLWLQTDYSDKTKFWAKRWFPTGEDDQEIQPKSCTIFVHGFIEYVDRYRNIFPLWPSRGHELIGFDQRGWGETMNATSDPKKNYGNVTWPQQFQDLEFVIRQTRKRLDEKWGKDKVKIFLFGQSMGGGIVLAFNCRSPEWKARNGANIPSQEALDMVSGVIGMAPWLKITKPPSALLIWASQKILSLIPEMPWKVALEGKGISSDPVIAYNIENDPFSGKKVYLKSIQGPLIGGMEMVDSEYKYWPEDKSVMIIHGDADLVTSFKASELFLERVQAKDKEFKPMAGYYHDIIQEPGEKKVIAANVIIDWVDARSKL